MKPDIKLFAFTEGQDELNDILGMLNGTFVRHYGSLQTTTGHFVEFVGSSNKAFTHSQLKADVAAKFEHNRNYYSTDVTDEAIAEFLK